MFKRMLALFMLLLVPVLALSRANDDTQPARRPTFVVRVASLDSLLDNLKLLGSLVGSDDLGKNLDEAIKSKLGPKGLFGIDGKKPIGFYGDFGGDDVDLQAVLMLPTAGDKSFKEMLEALGWKISGAQNGLHAVKQTTLAIDLQYRLANGYAYLGRVDQNTLAADKLVSPQAAFAGKPAAAIALALRLDQIPNGVRARFLDFVKNGLGKTEDKAGEGAAQKVLRIALSTEIIRIVDSVLKEGEELTAQIDIDQHTKQLSADLTLVGKAGSKLAEQIAKLGQRRTLFSGVLEKDAALNGLINLELPTEVRKALTGVIQESMDKVLADLQNAGVKKQGADLFDALKPSLTAPDLDAGFSLRGPNKSKQFTLVAGIKLSQGLKLETTFIELTKSLPDKERNAIKLNADKAGNAAIHRLELQGSFDATIKEVFGDNPLFLSFRDDALFLAIGEDGLTAIKKAVTTPAKGAAPLQFDVSMTRLAMLDKSAAQAAETRQKAGDDGRIKLVLEGGSTLRLRFSMGLSVLQMVGKEK